MHNLFDNHRHNLDNLSHNWIDILSKPLDKLLDSLLDNLFHSFLHMCLDNHLHKILDTLFDTQCYIRHYKSLHN